MLDIVQLPRRKEQVRVHSLSLREQRAVELARALMMRPQLLLLDEPVSGMDPAERPAWITYIREVQTHLGLTMILVEHSMKVVAEISDWVVVLSSGRMLAAGTAGDVLSDPQVRSVYIGRGTKNA
jgi:branched-chain amino acid transport system ATP-binding protein